MPFTETEIPGLLIIEPDVFEDDRGYFLSHTMNQNLTGRAFLYNGYKIINHHPKAA